MDSHVATTVMAALVGSLRETDYIGWYLDGRIVGAVLTVLVQESMAQVSSHIQKRLAEVLQSELSIEEGRRLQTLCANISRTLCLSSIRVAGGEKHPS